jgi:hypothetical protein
VRKVVGEVEDVEKAESRSSKRGKDALGSENGENHNDATTFCNAVNNHRSTLFCDFGRGLQHWPGCGIFEAGPRREKMMTAMGFTVWKVLFFDHWAV